MSKVRGISLSDYSSFLKLDRINYNLWARKYIQRTGRDTLRGWQYSREYRGYAASRADRVDRLMSQNLDRWFQNPIYYFSTISTWEGWSKGFNAELDFKDIEAWNAPMEMVQLLEYMRVQARAKGLPFKVAMELSGDAGVGLYFGMGEIKRAIIDLVDKWRELVKFYESEGMKVYMEISGRLAAKETQFSVTAVVVLDAELRIVEP